MKAANRDLLLLSKKASLNPQELEHEVEMLNNLLFHVESIFNFCTANQIVDVSRRKVHDKFERVEKVIRKGLKPFQFLHNKN